MVSSALVFAALAAVASAAPSCRAPPAYVLPKVGGSDELAAPAPNLVLKKIAMGHGIQNYTCASPDADATATGAVAVLYDVTSFYPGTRRSGISQRAWDDMPSSVLRHTTLPLNKLDGTRFGADPDRAFPDPSDLRLPGQPPARFLGHHYFDTAGVPVFDLAQAGLRAAVKKIHGVDAPAAADKGIINTGAVAWLHLDDNGAGISRGVASVFRVITAGGAPQPCAVAGSDVQSVPYTTYYWFYG